jgi:acyl-CoA thioester hydrolase
MSQSHDWPVRVYYEDTDAEGVVYFANYLKFMERGRTEWLRALGVEQDRLLSEHGLVFTVTGTDVRFRRPARFNDQLIVRTRLIDISRVRFSLSQDVFRDGEAKPLVNAQCEAACVDAETFRPRRIPAGLLDGLRPGPAVRED